ncbi:hypothetical protein [Spirosoma koreense]
MKYLLTLFISWLMLPLVGYGQCVVSLDEQKRLVTTCDNRPSSGGFLLNRPDRSQALSRSVYLGSEYLTFPIWQPGTLEIYQTKKSISCQIAYNVVTNELRCRFDGDNREYAIAADAFTVDGKRFISQISNQLGKPQRVYYMVLYAGRTKLLKQVKSKLVLHETDAYDSMEGFDGIYKQQKLYYIQKENEAPKRVDLTRKSVLHALGDQLGRLTQHLTSKKLTDYELAETVAYYDGFQ